MPALHRMLSLSLAGSVALAAGLALPAPAAAQQAQPQVTVANGGTRLMLNGAMIRQSQGRISNQRMATFDDSRAVMIAWDEHTRSGKVSYFAVSPDGRGLDAVSQTENKVRLRYAIFDPAAGEPNMPASLRAGAENQLFLVQFIGTPLEEMRREIRRRGGSIHRFLTDNTHVVHMPAEAAAELAGLPFVRWVGAYHPAYRLDTDVLAQLQSGRDIGTARYSIECMEVGMKHQQSLADFITAQGGIVENFTPDQHRMEATLTQAQLIAVLHRHEVNYIDPWGGPGGTDMDIVRQIGGAVPLLSNQNFLGQGVRGEVFDTEVQSNHPQWGGQSPLIHGTNGSSGFHGSACYGINFASTGPNAQATGLMPQREQGIFFWYTQSSQFTGGMPTRLTLNTQAVDPGGPYRSVFQTSSVGSAQVSNYTTISAETDDYLFKVDYLSCQSQSNLNSTSSRPQAWAKNIVAVGGVQHNNTLTRADDGNSGASFGPATDGRMKPELAHFYDATFTTDNASGYTDFGGTSGATPITAGHFGLLHQMWHQATFPGFGGGSSVFASRPKSTTARALMINTAYRYPLNQLSRARQGWGMADLTKLYNDRFKFFIVNGDNALTNGQTATYNLLVLGGEPEFRVTMVYPDPQGNPAAAQHRINDLTLKVTDPNGVVYWGNNGHTTNNYTPAGGSANTIDTVENVFVQNPAGGTWTVQVMASQIVQDGNLATPALDAVYSLVASNVQLGPPPPTGACCLPTAPCTITSQASCTSLGGTYNGDNSTCATANCPPIGACCMGDGTCTYMTPTACASAGGAYRGDNSQCATANCSGACCLPDGSCTSTGPASCTSQGGIYRGDGTACATANCPLPPGVWVEQGEAGDLPATAQVTMGSNALLEIRGDGSATDDVDMFKIQICNAGTFEATTVNGANWDTQLFLFNASGLGVVCNDDAATGGTQSRILSTLIPGNGTYYLAISRYNRDPSSPGGLIFPNSPFNLQHPPTGPGGTQAVSSWSGGATGSNYTIYLTGACFAEPAPTVCYANCDGSTTSPVLNVADFSCFLTKFAAGESYANCDQSTTPPVLNVADFSCFLTKFAAGCP